MNDGASSQRSLRGRGRLPSLPAAPPLPDDLLALAETRLPARKLPGVRFEKRLGNEQSWAMLVADYAADPHLGYAQAAARYGLGIEYVRNRLKRENRYRRARGSQRAKRKFWTIVCARCDQPFSVTTKFKCRVRCPPCMEAHAADRRQQSESKRQAVKLAVAKMRKMGYTARQMAVELGMSLRMMMKVVHENVASFEPFDKVKRRRDRYDLWMRWRTEDGCSWNEVAKRAGLVRKKTVKELLHRSGYDTNVPATILSGVRTK
jgi:hypothetical protein